MRFTISWLPGPKFELARLWATAEDPKAVAKIADTIDRLLATNTFERLTPVDNLYFLRVDRLVVLCDVSEADRTVTIIDLQFYESK